MTQPNPIDEVILAEKGTPLATFQKERTDAISEMFDNVDDIGIYPTGKFFARLDKCVTTLLAEKERAERQRFYDELVERVEGERAVYGRTYTEYDGRALLDMCDGYNDALDRVKQIALEISKK